MGPETWRIKLSVRLQTSKQLSGIFKKTGNHHFLLSCPYFVFPKPSFCSCAGAALCGPPSGRFPQPSTSLATWASPSTTSCFSPPCFTYFGNQQPFFWASQVPNSIPEQFYHIFHSISSAMWHDFVFCLPQVHLSLSPSWLDVATLLHTHPCDHHCDTRPALYS